MANTKSVAIQMKQILDEFTDKVNEVLEESADSTAEEAVDKLRSTSPSKSGDYASGWRVKKFHNGGVVVHNATNWQLTWLLENGHRIVNKKGEFGRVNGIKHIKPVENWANREFQRRIKEGLE